MKAWIVGTKDEFNATVVFAETRGKARASATHTGACEDADFCKIEVCRAPSLDKYYKVGKKEMDWVDSKDRVALVKEAGFTCEEFRLEECADCPANEYCDKYQDYQYYKDEQEDAR